METGNSPGGCDPGAALNSERGAGRLDRKPTIAIVDDDPFILRALDRLTRSRGCLARVFTSPVEFIGSVAAAPPDCLILDVQMTGMSGLDLHRWLLERGFNFPVIFITAHEDPNAEAQASRAGAAGFFYKPFHNEALWAAVLNALAARRARSAA